MFRILFAAFVVFAVFVMVLPTTSIEAGHYGSAESYGSAGGYGGMFSRTRSRWAVRRTNRQANRQARRAHAASYGSAGGYSSGYSTHFSSSGSYSSQQSYCPDCDDLKSQETPTTQHEFRLNPDLVTGVDSIESDADFLNFLLSALPDSVVR